MHEDGENASRKASFNKATNLRAFPTHLGVSPLVLINAAKRIIAVCDGDDGSSFNLSNFEEIMGMARKQTLLRLTGNRFRDGSVRNLQLQRRTV